MPNPITKIKTSDDVVHDIEVDLSNYYDKSETDLLLSAKADDADTYSKEEVQLALATKANVTDVYDKDAIDHLLGDKADKSNTYTEIEVDTLLLAKANAADVYTKTEADNLLAGKADVGDSYTKAEDDALLAGKANSADVYTITQTDGLLADKAGIDDSSITATMATWSADKLNVEFNGKADSSDVVPTGAILPFGGTSAPTNYLMCDGSEVLIEDYQNLYNVIGDGFGTATDALHFVLPDMRECVPKGAGLTGKTVGAHLDADGLAVGEFLDDRFQGHEHTQYYSSTRASFTTAGGSGMDNQSTTTTTGIVTDSVHGTPRVGDTTEVKSVGVNFIIKY